MRTVLAVDTMASPTAPPTDHSGRSSYTATCTQAIPSMLLDMTKPAFAAPLSLRLSFTPRHLAAQQVTHKMAPSRPLTSAQEIQPPPATGRGGPDTGQVRIRQHLNPLARRWSQPVTLSDDWYALAFRDQALPLVVDVGVAKGRFLHKLACANPKRNFLGLEIREPLVHQANRCAADAGLSNLFYIACNANVSLGRVLADAPGGVLQEVYVQFCDPWFKKRHAKRRMVNMPLVDDICVALKAASDTRQGERRVFMQSDVLEVAEEMRNIFDGHGALWRLGDDDGFACFEQEWLKDNPVGTPTEREIAVLSKGLGVYRALYVLNEGDSTPS